MHTRVCAAPVRSDIMSWFRRLETIKTRKRLHTHDGGNPLQLFYAHYNAYFITLRLYLCGCRPPGKKRGTTTGRLNGPHSQSKTVHCLALVCVCVFVCRVCTLVFASRRRTRDDIPRTIGRWLHLYCTAYVARAFYVQPMRLEVYVCAFVLIFSRLYASDEWGNGRVHHSQGGPQEGRRVRESTLPLRYFYPCIFVLKYGNLMLNFRHLLSLIITIQVSYVQLFFIRISKFKTRINLLYQFEFWWLGK